MFIIKYTFRKKEMKESCQQQFHEFPCISFSVFLRKMLFFKYWALLENKEALFNMISDMIKIESVFYSNIIQR